MVQSHDARSQPQPPKLLEQVREAIRARHYSLRTEETYLRWIKRFILFHDKRHPREMGGQEVQQFLSHLAVEGRVAAPTQSQALSAIVFLYQQVLKQDIGWMDEVVRAKQPHRVSVVLTQGEVTAVLRHLSGTAWITVTLLYGAGLRLMECIRLRVKDVDFSYNQIVVRDGKGHKDRVTMLPQNVQAPLQRHLHNVQKLHAVGSAGGPWAHLPAVCAGAQIPQCQSRVGVAICLPCRAAIAGPTDWHHPAASHPQTGPAAGGADRGPEGGDPQGGELSYLAAQLCDPSARSGVRHPDGAGTPWAQRRQYDDDIHPGAQPRWSRGQEPGRPTSGSALRGACLW